MKQEDSDLSADNTAARAFVELPPALSDKDRDIFLAALGRPVRPPPGSVQKAKQRYTALVVSSM